MKQDKLIELEARNQAILQALPDIFFRINKDLVFVDCYVQDESVLLLPPSKIIGSKAKDILPEELYEQMKEKLRLVLETNEIEIYDYRLIVDNKEEWFDTRMVPSTKDEVLVIIRNITEKKKAETLLKNANEEYLAINEELQESFEKISEINTELEEAKEKAEEGERKLNTLISNLKGMVYRCNNDNDWTMEFVSDGVKELTGYNAEDLISNQKISWADIIKPEYRQMVWDEIQLALKQKKQFALSYEIICANGKTKWIQEQGQGIFKNKKLEALEGIVTDVTPFKKIEKELIKARDRAEESDRLKSAFLANMSHEIRTPMNGIIGFSEMIMRPNLTDERRNFYAKTVIDSSRQLLNIVNDILDISRIQIGTLKLNHEEVVINDLLMSLYAFYKQQSQEKLVTLKINTGLNNYASTIKTDKGRLRQILSNLINNALKFTQKGSVEFGYRLNEDHLHFYVKDTGIGVAKSHQEDIFESFRQEDDSYTRKYGGTGLGLSISKKLVEMLGGRIWVESEKQKGAIFNFTIPYTPIYKDALTKNDEQSNDFTVLIAEDEDVNYFYVLEVISDLNVNIIRTKDGLETVDICKSDPNIDLVLMDIKMPIMNGYEATRAIKKVKPNLPVIAQTAYAMDKDRDEAMAVGCDNYLSKPIDADELIEMVKSYL